MKSIETNSMTIGYLSLGSNLGDRRKNIRSALAQIGDSAFITLLRCSPLYETEPVGLPAGAPLFLNGAAEIDTALPPRELLERLLAMEQELGRMRSANARYESRTIDLDILLFGDLIISEPGLQIPHPRMHERWFVLKPLADLCPDRIIPGCSLSVSEVLRALEGRPTNAIPRNLV